MEMRRRKCRKKGGEGQWRQGLGGEREGAGEGVREREGERKGAKRKREKTETGAREGRGSERDSPQAFQN